jgi:hypothetical protein
MALLHPPPKDDPDPKAMERYFDAFVAAERTARLAVRAIVKGGEAPDLDALEDGAQVLEVLRTGLFRDDRVQLTEQDVAAARHLVDLVRAGAAKEEVMAAAQRVHKIMNRPHDPSRTLPREEIERTWLDALRRLGIEPTEDDIRDVRRLAALSVEDVEDEVEARLESQEICRRLFPPPAGSRS